MSVNYRKSGNFVVKIFSYVVTATKIKHTGTKYFLIRTMYVLKTMKYFVTTKFFNTKILLTKYFQHENFLICGIAYLVPIIKICKYMAAAID